MAEPESILQLGIEAAREGKKEEARQLFRLLTRQEPDNSQGWLWLAGVAENREERQNALERVLAFEPENEMALKGLQALGVRPSSVDSIPDDSPPPAASVPTPPAPAPIDDDPFGDDDPFAELNNLSETMASDTSGPVRRAETVVEASDSAASSGSPVAATGAASSRRTDSSAARATSSPRRADSSASSRNPRRPAADEYESSSSGGLNPLLGLLLFLVGLGLIGLLIAFLFPGLFDRKPVATINPAQTTVTRTAEAGLVATSVVSGSTQPTINPSAPVATIDPNAPVATIDPNAPVAATAPVPTTVPNTGSTPAGQPTPPPADVSKANPAIVNANTPLQSGGWLYDFNQPTYAASIIGNLGQHSPKNGRFVVVLAFAVNNTGTAQAIPGNFFVLKDAQGRVWESRPEVSTAYVVPDVNADLAQTSPLPPDGITRSIAVVFDVAPDATDLVFFARSNPLQGWIVLRSV